MAWTIITDDMTTEQKIRMALSDPDAPWYGSDLVGWVGDEIERLEKIIYDLMASPDATTMHEALLSAEEVCKRVDNRAGGRDG